MRANFFDSIVSTGGACENVRVTVYRAGTSVLASCYKFSGGTQLAPNPSVTDANGTISLWLEPGAYSITYQDQTQPQRFPDTTFEYSALSGGTGGIEGSQIESSSFNSARIPDGAITGDKMGLATITGTNNNAAANSVRTQELLNGGTGITGLSDTSNWPALSLRRSTTQSIPNATLTAISWNAEDMDSTSLFTPTSTSITLATSGVYLFTFSVNWSPTVTPSQKQVYIYADSNILALNVETILTYDSPSQSVEALVKCTAGQVIQGRVVHNYGSAGDITSARFQLQMVGE